VNPPRNLVQWTAALFLLAGLAIAAACGGGGDDDDSGSTGQLTNPENVPTATPWAQLPDPILLDPNNIQPLPPNQPNTGGETPSPAPGEPGVCGQTYTVIAGDTMFGIAEKCGVDPQRLIDVNPDADPASLNIGDVLIVPALEPEETEPPE
jgi:hypothetical protein